MLEVHKRGNGNWVFDWSLCQATLANNRSCNAQYSARQWFDIKAHGARSFDRWNDDRTQGQCFRV